MIKVNGVTVEIKEYPDGTPRINLDPELIKEEKFDGGSLIEIEWFYENDKELFYLFLVKKHLERHFSHVEYFLHMPYIPNARMDRVKSNDEVFTLKYFCDFINSMCFAGVKVLDAHSNVSAALLNNCFCDNPKKYIESALKGLPKDTVLYFPDAGAAKRYTELFPDRMFCYGEKKRDWKTGQIQGLEIRKNELDLHDKTVLMIDDIISYGGSFYYSAKALKEEGAETIYAFATHTEGSVLDKEKGTFLKALEDGTVEKLFTTNSIFTKQHEKITVMEV